MARVPVVREDSAPVNGPSLGSVTVPVSRSTAPAATPQPYMAPPVAPPEREAPPAPEIDPYEALSMPEPQREQLPAADPYDAVSVPAPTSPLVRDPAAPPENGPEGFVPLPRDRAIQRSTFGRVLDAFGEGYSDGFGEGRIGFDDDTLKVFEDAGLIGNKDGSAMSYFRSFNESFILPLANAPVIALEALGRGVEGGVKSVAKGAGQIALEAGADPGTAKRLTRDVVGIAEAIGIVTAALPVSMAVRATTPNTVRKIATGDAKAAEAVAKAPAATRVRAEREAVFEPFDDIEVPPAAVAKANEPQPGMGSVGASAAPEPGNLNLSRINAPEDVKDTLRSIAISNGGFQDARRGVMSFEETENLASIVGITPDDMLKIQRGQTFNAEELLAARQLLVASAHNVRAAAVKATGGDDAALVAYRETALRHQAIQEQVAGLTAEAGRALSQFRIMAGEVRDAKAVGALLESVKGADLRGDLVDHARAIAALDDPAAISKNLMDARKATKGEMFLEAWINGLLSGIQTHAANMAGNTLTVLNSAAETAVAAGVGTARNALTGGRAVDRVRMGEVSAELFGIAQGSLEGVRIAAKTFLTELPSDAATKLDQARRQAIPSKKIGGAIGSAVKKVTGVDLEIGGKQVRIPSRLLMAEDELFKAMARRQKINGLAYRTADAEGLTGTAKAQRIADLVANPTDAMKAEAQAHALTVTFQNPLGKLGNSIMNASNSHPIAKVIIPFVRTPINILKYPLKRTPLGLVSEEIRNNLLGRNGAVAFDQEAGRMILGTTISTAALGLAATGMITGAGPSDPAERALLRATGWQPNSVKIGDSYYSIARLEPMALYLGITADAYELMSKAGREDLSDEDREGLATAIVASFAKNASDKTFLRGISDLVQAISDPDRYGERYLKKMAGTAIPALVAQTARSIDPVLRDARTTIDTFKSRIPGLSKDLLPKRDVWGQKIVRGGAVGPDIASTIYTSREKNDPIARELIAIGYFPSQVSRNIAGVELTGEEYDRLQKVSGVLTRQALDRVMKLDEWPTYTSDARAKIARDVVNSTREKARNYLVMSNGELRKRIEAAALERRNKLLSS